MVFSSSFFLCAFLPAVILLYFLCRAPGYRNALLFLASLFFYAWGEPRNLLLLLTSVLINYLFALSISRRQSAGKGGTRLLLVISAAINCLILFVYKYLNFALENINALLSLLGSRSALPKTALSLPIGISFFTFQAMSYVVDVYRRTAPAQTSIINFGLYLSFFPQLIAGPIVRYSTVAEEISRRSVSTDDFAEGARRFILGLGKKRLIADTVALLADYAFETISYSPLGFVGAWFGAVCYTLQIYFDFSGYSDMALGLGRLFGFHFPENFSYPYAASSVTDFWRRWHISLSSWFRDYVYIPLGGSRVPKKRLFFNLLVVWLLTGIWHGANWTFIVWGLSYFVLLSLEKFTGLGALPKKSRLAALFCRLFTIIAVILCWVIFRSDNMTLAVKYIGCMLHPRAEYAAFGLKYFSPRYICVVLFSAFLSLPLARNVWRKIRPRLPRFLSAAAEDAFYLALLLLSLATAVSSTYNPFIYFNF